MNMQNAQAVEIQSQAWFKTLPMKWQNWLEANIQRGCDAEQLAMILKQHGLTTTLEERAQITAHNEPVTLQDESLQQELKHWLMECRLVGMHLEQILQNVPKPFNALSIEQTWTALDQDWVFQKLLDTQQKLNKCQWMMQTQDQLKQLNPHYNQVIAKVNAPSFQDFIQQYYSPQLPVILQNGIQHWPAAQLWTPAYFAEHYGKLPIEVQMNRHKDNDFEKNSVQLKRSTTMQDFVQHIQATGHSNDVYLTANNASKNQPLMQALYQDLDDFASGYCDLSQQQYFLWLGPAGTFTPLHYDLTNNLLIQIYGRKKVKLIPALQMPKMYNNCWVFSEVQDIKAENFQDYPLLKDVTPVECILEPGEALFIPIGWWHCVESLDVSISLSLTNFKIDNQFYREYPQDLIRYKL